MSAVGGGWGREGFGFVFLRGGEGGRTGDCEVLVRLGVVVVVVPSPSLSVLVLSSSSWAKESLPLTTPFFLRFFFSCPGPVSVPSDFPLPFPLPPSFRLPPPSPPASPSPESDTGVAAPDPAPLYLFRQPCPANAMYRK